MSNKMQGKFMSNSEKQTIESYVHAQKLGTVMIGETNSSPTVKKRKRKKRR